MFGFSEERTVQLSFALENGALCAQEVVDGCIEGNILVANVLLRMRVRVTVSRYAFRLAGVSYCYDQQNNALWRCGATLSMRPLTAPASFPLQNEVGGCVSCVRWKC